MEREKLKIMARRKDLPSKEVLLGLSNKDLYWFDVYRKKISEVKSGKESQEVYFPMVRLRGSGRILFVSDHARKRFLERTDAKGRSRPNQYLKEDLSRSFPGKIRRGKASVLAKLNHNYEEAEYRFGFRTGICYVIVGDVVKTCHMNESNRVQRA